MSDLISRQAAIDAVMEIYNAVWEIDIPSPGSVPEYIEHHEGCQSVMQRIKEIVYTIECMESTEPKKGKWKGYKAEDPEWFRDDGQPLFLVCSECNRTVANIVDTNWNFCPNCGAEMEQQEE